MEEKLANKTPNKTICNYLGEQLKAEREKGGKTQPQVIKEVEKKLGTIINLRTWQRWECEINSMYKIQELSIGMGFDLVDFIREATKRMQSTTENVATSSGADTSKV